MKLRAPDAPIHASWCSCRDCRVSRHQDALRGALPGDLRAVWGGLLAGVVAAAALVLAHFWPVITAGTGL